MTTSHEDDEQDEFDEDEILLFSLAYCSRAIVPLGHDDIVQLVSAAQKHNAQVSITGWLVYSDGIFFQWLEGAREQVTRLMASITADARHSSIVVLSEAEEVRSRLFLGWDMELVSANDIRAVLIDAIDASDDSNSAELLQQLLKELESKSIGAPD